jgi:hypothetical protein
VITADAVRCQREHVTYLAERGARWILTVKGNQLHLACSARSLTLRITTIAAGTRHHARDSSRPPALLCIT